jgi:hypothetical protein
MGVLFCVELSGRWYTSGRSVEFSRVACDAFPITGNEKRQCSCLFRGSVRLVVKILTLTIGIMYTNLLQVKGVLRLI